MKSSTPDLIKFKRLQRRLGESKRGITGLLELLWIATAQNCPSGDIGKFSNEEIATMCDWEGDHDKLVTSLVDCGWLDNSPAHRLVVHDWRDHAPNHVARNLARWKRKFATIDGWEDYPSSGNETPTELPADDPVEPPMESPVESRIPAQRVSPSQAKPSLTKPNQVKPSQKGEVRELDQGILDCVEEVVHAVGTPVERDHRLLGQIGWIMAKYSDVGPQIRDAIHSVKAVENRPKRPCAYIRGVLNDSIGKDRMDRLLRNMSRKKVEPYLRALQSSRDREESSEELSRVLKMKLTDLDEPTEASNLATLRKMAESERTREPKAVKLA